MSFLGLRIMDHLFGEGNHHTGPLDPQGHRTSRLFQVLCVLVILGNLALIVVNLLKVGMLEAGIGQGGVGAAAVPYLRGLLAGVLLSCAGAALGAVFMLGGRLLGYRIYAVSTVLHLVLTFCAMLLWAATIYLLFVSVLLFFYALIPLGFLWYFHRHRGHLV